MAKRLRLLLIAVLSAYACAPDADTGGDVATSEAQALQAMNPRNRFPGRIVDANGRNWSCMEKARYTVVGPNDLARADDDSVAEGASDLASRSIEEIAEALRTVSEIAGYECVGDPDFDLAAKIKSGFGAGRKREGSARIQPPEAQKRNKAPCCGTDQRNVLSGLSAMRDSLLLMENGCTAFFVHPSVAVTAAHCLYDTVNNAFLRVPDGSGGTRTPRYRLAVNGSGGPYTVLSCWRSNVSQEYKNASSDGIQDDYGFVDFSGTSSGPCSNPTPAPAWLGSWVASDADFVASTSGLRLGYPFGVNPGNNICGTLNQNQTWANGIAVDAQPYFMLATAFWTGVSTYEMRHSLDVSPGDSGSPTLITDGIGWYAASIQSRASCSSNGQARDRRWNAVMDNWLVANTPL